MKFFIKKIIIWILFLETKIILKKYNPQIVAITGSVGKTGTKDVVFAMFSNLFYTQKSPKSFNSEVGIPLSIIGCQNSGWRNPISWLKVFWSGLALICLPSYYPKWLILEVGADRPGDIKKVSEWLKIDIAIFTRMGEIPVHVEFFNSPEAVLKEKLFLLKALKPDGTIIFNSDDPILKEKIDKITSHKKLSYGFERESHITASNYKIVYENHLPIGINFKADFNGTSLPVKILGTLGRHQAYAILAGISAVVSQDSNPIKAIEGLNGYESPAGRMKIIPGVKNSLVIDDSYNSSPVAVLEALQTMSSLEIPGRKFIALGDMMEIGQYSIEEHKKVGALAAEFADFIFTVGLRAKNIAEGALQAGFSNEKIFQFEDSGKAGKQIEIMVQKGDVVLIKGSQAVRMEKATEEIMAEPMKKDELLVRQEPQWRMR